MQANQYRILAELSLFTSFSPMDLEGLFSKQSYSIRNYVKNQMIYLSGDSCTSLDILLEGSVSLQSLDEEGSLFKAQVLEKGPSMGLPCCLAPATSFP